METAEKIETINRQLTDTFGIDTVTGQSIWRVVFSDDQFETRHGTYEDRTTSGIFIREVTETREVPKYRQYIQAKYILERLVGIPIQNMAELPALKMSYEPIWTFEDARGNYLPPKWDACKFIIDTVYAAQYGTGNLKKYVDPDNNQENYLENQRKRIDGYVEELFGEQSGLGGATKTGEAIIVPRNFERGS